MRRSIGLVVVLVMAACSPATLDESVDTTWVGTITTEGNVTTVVNESGSVWGGAATLVEELSIGVSAGRDEYMFGRISSLAATDDFIYVIDAQVPALRVYDQDGNFVHNLGGEGQGPGEYTSPSLLAADSSNRAYLYDSQLRRVNVYGPEGEILGPWPFPDARCCAWPIYPLSGEAVWAPVQEWFEDRSGRRFGLQAVGPDGPYGEIVWIPELEIEQATVPMASGGEDTSPFSPWLTWNPAPYGRLVVGTSDRYWFQVHAADGSQLVVERYWEPIPVSAERREWERGRKVAFRQRYDGPEFQWDGASMPEHKAAYTSLISALSGETWVFRQGASVRLSDCAEDPIAEGHPAAFERPCWEDEQIIDVFGDDGRYLGEVDVPQGISLSPMAMNLAIDGDRIVTVAEDEAGTIMVKRYRLVLPGEE